MPRGTHRPSNEFFARGRAEDRSVLVPYSQPRVAKVAYGPFEPPRTRTCNNVATEQLPCQNERVGLIAWMVQTSLGTLLVSICLHSIVRKRVSSVGVALIMDHSGMIHLLAKDVSESVGPAFPLFSPLIGTLGAFVTGSNTNSNVIFAPLQQQTAALIGTSVLVLLGAQTTGGALGYAGASQGDRGL